MNGTTEDFTDNITMTVNFTQNFTEEENMTMTTVAPRPLPPMLSPGYYADTMTTLLEVIPPIIIVWGILSNLLTFLILLRQIRKNVSSTTMYLMALAFSDTVILLCGPLRYFILYTWEEDVRNYTDGGCKIQLYLTSASVHMSSWLLAAVTMERVVIMLLPRTAKTCCTPKIAGIVIFVIFLCVFGLNICVPVIYGHVAVIKTDLCAPTSEKNESFRKDTWGTIDACMVFFIPSMFLFFGNIVIIYHTFKARQSQTKITSQPVAPKTKIYSVMLVLLFVVFLATMMPFTIIYVGLKKRLEKIEIQFMVNFKEAWYALHFLQFEYAVVSLVSYSNACFNFIVYIVSDAEFRMELTEMICKCYKGPSVTKSANTADGSQGISTVSQSDGKGV